MKIETPPLAARPSNLYTDASNLTAPSSVLAKDREKSRKFGESGKPMKTKEYSIIFSEYIEK